MMLLYTWIGIVATGILPPAPLNTLLPAVHSEDMPYIAPLKLYCEQETTRDLLKCRPWVRRFGGEPRSSTFLKSKLILLLWKLSFKKQNSQAQLGAHSSEDQKVHDQEQLTYDGTQVQY